MTEQARQPRRVDNLHAVGYAADLRLKKASQGTSGDYYRRELCEGSDVFASRPKLPGTDFGVIACEVP